MKQVVGLPKSEGTRITAVALSRLQSRMSGVTAIEQISTKAESIVVSIYPAVKAGIATILKLAPRAPSPRNATRGHRSVRVGVAVCFMPFGARTTHIMQFGPIRIEKPLFQFAPILHRRRQNGRRKDDLRGVPR